MTDMADARPVILSYCARFLPREMLHVYRQVTAITKFENWVVTRHRENADRFPYPRVCCLRKGLFRALTRAYYRSLGTLVPVGRSEVRQMLEVVREKNAALVHVYLGSEALRALRFLEFCPAARIVSFHGADLSQHYPVEKYRELWCRAELFLCRSESLKEQLMAKGCPAERIRLNRTGVPVPQEASTRSRRRREPPDPLRLFQACRFIPKKGLDVSLEAVKKLKDRGISATLTLAGEGPEEEPLRRRAAELGIAELVRFAGFISEDELRRAFESHDLFVHPSRTTPTGDREGIPNALLEAMAWGMPVISTHHSGIPEAIADGVSGVLIPEADAGLLADVVEGLAAAPQRLDSLSQRAADTVRERFSIQRCVENLETIYAEASSMAGSSVS
jgi:colanic acid/amylovoran biosynthesis glycosyltransferase